MWTRFTRYWLIIHTFYKRIVFIQNIHQGTVKRILHEELSLRKVNFKWIPHLLDNDQELERFQLSTELLEFLESKSGLQLENIYKGWIVDSLRQSAIFHVSKFGYCEANSCATIDRSEEGDNLSLFLAFWNRERGHPTITRNIQSWVLCQKILADLDKERAQNRPTKCSRDTFLYLDNATPHQALRDLIASES
jgi:hypothetical protein